MNRREQMKALFALGASMYLPQVPQAPPGGAIPPEGIGRRIRHLAYSDIGGRPVIVQIMWNRNHLYVGHMFSNGLTILDAADPRRLKPVDFFTGGDYTRTHHLQVAEDLLLLANGANIVAMQSYDNLRGYFENALADSITNRKKFRSGLSIHDISHPPGMKEIVSRWWLPGMNRAAGETSTQAPGRRVALHHMLTSGNRGYGAWRDGGLTVHDLGDPARPKLISHINWSPPFPGGTHTPLPLPGRKLAVVADEANAEKCAKGTFCTFVVDLRAEENPVPISTLPAPKERDFCGFGTFGPHNLHENRPGTYRSEETIFATYNVAGVRVFDIRDQYAPKEIASWVPPTPRKLIDPRPNVSLAAKTADIFVQKDGLMFVSDWNAGLNVLQYEG